MSITHVISGRSTPARGRLLPLVFAVLFGGLGGLVGPTVEAAETATDLVLGVGETRALSLGRGGDAKVIVGDQEVLGVTALVEAGEVSLTGLKTGVSSLVVFDGRGRSSYVVRVYGVPPEVVAVEARQLVSTLPGVEVRRVGDRVVLDGRVNSKAECERIERVVAMYPGSIESLVTCDDAGAAERPMFAIELQVVDISDVDGLDVGIEWPTAFRATARGQLGFDDSAAPETVMTGVINAHELGIGLRLMTAEGRAEIRTRSTLITEQDNPAHYAVGGEYFVRTGGLNGGSLETVEYGTRLTIRPSMDERRHMRLVIDASISQPDGSQDRTIEDVPGLLTNEVKTRVNLREGETAILSGLDDRRESEAEAGLWPLAEIPVLGYLFRTHTSDRAHRRTLILVTPRLYRPGDGFHQQQIEPMLQREPGGDDDF